MKKLCVILAVTVFFGITLVTSSIASNCGHEGEHSGHAGKLIHSDTVDGYRLAYHLIDIRKHVKDRKDIDVTHHLMVYITDPEGHALNKAKVGYLITGPNGEKQKRMTMGMGGGFGADVKFKEEGAYTVKTKIVVGKKRLLNQFAYEVK